MATLMSYAAAIAPTGSRVSQEASKASGRSPLGYEVAVNTPPLENIALIILAVAGICALIAIVIVLCQKLSQPSGYRSLNQRMQEDRSFIRNEFFNATYDILKESVRHSLGGRRNNRH